jgi:hypothetical protein
MRSQSIINNNLVSQLLMSVIVFDELCVSYQQWACFIVVHELYRFPLLCVHMPLIKWVQYQWWDCFVVMFMLFMSSNVHMALTKRVPQSIINHKIDSTLFMSFIVFHEHCVPLRQWVHNQSCACSVVMFLSCIWLYKLRGRAHDCITMSSQSIMSLLHRVVLSSMSLFAVNMALCNLSSIK